ncbi:eukaryotic porin family protein [Eremomyces bilateralis CBS 781.70]|uniref:Eukaryotic porin family protein n=1 Tax=Eremomyces bilateralis CBS 781.70 TaxID=1392243 RepID=A0A6G1G419_9PEZI|nr:eukaryotic porin family protein [Eremomyces bilateralis CBS 781.70]KAF1812845.1 eukaryotic porin family protein [Eremomyces bilateralis CBS 781.70]
MEATSSTTSTTSGFLSPVISNPLFDRVRNTYRTFHEKRESLGLSNPGTVEKISKEVDQDVFLNNLAFTGVRAEFNKVIGVSPMFQLSHAFAMGAQGMPPYSYNAMYGSSKHFLQATIDSDLAVNGRFNRRITNALVTKFSVNLPQDSMQQPMLQAEADYNGADFTAVVKSMNPSIFNGGLTGMVIGSYLQSVTPKLALGMEGMWQRLDMQHPPDVMMSYVGRYKTREWIASARVLGQGAVQASFWKRLSEKVEAGADLNLSFAGMGNPQAAMMGAPGKEGVATFGVKYDFRASSYRAQIDSQGKMGCLLEKSIAPPVRVTFSGELDQWKQQVKVGLAVSIESADPELMEQQQSMTEGPSIPF